MAVPAACPVLVVEDDPDLREMMCVSLEHEGFVPHAARDGLDALEQLRAGRVEPQVILLDLMMPRMDGVEFCRAREHDPALRQIPVVVLSASPFVSPELRAAAVFTKPFEMEALVEAVRACAEGLATCHSAKRHQRPV
jgi:CheY-like chemotaxis protein